MSLSPKEEAVLDLLHQDVAYENYFFRKVEAIKWFYPLKERGFFSPQKAPAPQPSDQEGYFVVPQWNVLLYLEKISGQVNIPLNAEYVEELVQIIKEVSNHKDSEGDHLDNYRTWWYFVKILVNIPREKIPIEIIDLIPIWLDSKFDTSLPAAEILNKLLPKLLLSQPTKEDVEKAERIIQYATTLKPEKTNQTNRFRIDGEQYKPVVGSHWLEQAFKKYSADIGEKCSENVIRDLSEKIRVLLKREESRIPISIHDKSYLFVLKDDGIYYLFEIFKAERGKREIDLLGEILAKHEIAGEIITRIKIEKRPRNEILSEFYRTTEKAGLLKSVEPDVFKRQVKKLYNNLIDKGTYHSFYEEQKYLDRKPLELFTFILKGIISAKAKSNTEKNISETKSILNSFFGETFLFFTKMALYITAYCVDRYGDLFWKALADDTAGFIIDDVYFGDELKHLLQGLSGLTEAEKKILKRKIDGSVKGYAIEAGNEAYIARLKQKWYQALSFDPEFKSLYEKMKEVSEVDAELGPAIRIAVTWEGPGPSALTKDEILSKPNSEIAEFLSIFKGKDPWRGPTFRGLAEVLKQAVQEHPRKFLDDFKPFLNAGYLYVYYMLWGFRDAWRNKREIDCGILLNFIELYINQDNFWEDRLPTIDDRLWNPGHKDVVGMAGELIQEGTKNDTWAFPEVCFEAAKKIVFSILDKLTYPAEGEGEYSDHVSHALNSSFGRAIAALIFLALRIARVNEKRGDSKEIKWGKEFKETYDHLINKGLIEAFTWLGHYLPQLSYLDKQWAGEKILYLEGKKGEKKWEAFMDGYLYGGTVYDEIYKLMKPHYEYAISYPFKDSHDRESVVQHVSIGYLRGNETIEGGDSLFRKILDKWKHEQIKEIISFFWMQREYISRGTEGSEKIGQKIIEFWRWVYGRYACKDVSSYDKNDKILLSDTSKLTVFLTQIGAENVNWLMLSAPYVGEDYNTPFFIEYLDLLKDKGDKLETAHLISQVYLRMLEYNTPDYDKAHIRSIVEFLYNAGTKESANDICNLYERKGYELLRDIYEKNRKG